jgi:CarboxypepD_reg-like domain
MYHVKMKYVRELFLFAFILLLPSTSTAQIILGKILDSLTQEPISYAHIYSEPFDLGTISNELGEFEIRLPTKGSVSLTISHIAYSPVSISVKNDTILNIPMSKNIVYLHAVVVNDKALQIAKEVLANLKEAKINYGKAFYRQIAFQDTVATELIEAFYNVSFSLNGIDKINLEQARFARKKHVPGAVFFSHTNFSYLTVGYNLYAGPGKKAIGRPFATYFFDQYDFTLKEEYKKGLDSYVVIEFNPSKNLDNPINSYGYFVYNMTQKRLLEYSVFIDHALGADEIVKHDVDQELKITKPKYSWKFGFSDAGNLIDFILVEFNYDLIVDGEAIPAKASSKMVFYKKSSRPHKNLREPGLALEDVSIFKNAKYKPKFWRDNPIIKRTPREESIISGFEKENAFGTFFK